MEYFEALRHTQGNVTGLTVNEMHAWLFLRIWYNLSLIHIYISDKGGGRLEYIDV